MGVCTQWNMVPVMLGMVCKRKKNMIGTYPAEG